jgi:glyoxylase-like metal-dependent hydrolase (beta-lactamase superfamily II)
VSNDDWTVSGVFEVVPGVYRIPLPLPNDGLKAVNVYAITGGDGPVLIDSGWSIPEAKGLLSDALRELGCGFADIQRFLITHMHRDHYSQAIHLRRDFNTQVTLGADEKFSLEIALVPNRIGSSQQTRYLRELGATELADLMEAHRGKVDLEDWELPTDWFTDREVLDANGRALEVVETPGHTRGHVVFYDNAASLLFAGDHVLPTITPSIGFEPALAENPLGAFLASLAIVRDRPDAMLLPAHGPVTGSAHARVDELVEFHRLRLEAMSAVLGWGSDTAYAVAGKVTWTRRERALTDLDMFNQFLAICETGAHLDLLVSQGKATREITDNVRHYTLV